MSARKPTSAVYLYFLSCQCPIVCPVLAVQCSQLYCFLRCALSGQPLWLYAYRCLQFAFHSSANKGAPHKQNTNIQRDKCTGRPRGSRSTMRAEHLPTDHYINQWTRLAANAHRCPLVTRAQGGYYQRIEQFTEELYDSRMNILRKNNRRTAGDCFSSAAPKTKCTLSKVQICLINLTRQTLLHPTQERKSIISERRPELRTDVN